MQADKRSEEMKKMDLLEKSVIEANNQIKKHFPKLGGKQVMPTRSKHAPNFKMPVPELTPIKEEVVAKKKPTPSRQVLKTSPQK